MNQPRLFNHVMVDLETMGTQYNSPVLSIGACFFDPLDVNPETRIGPTFSMNINWDSAFEFTKPDPSTIKWWMRQDAAAQNAVCKPGVPSKDALIAFGKWYRALGWEDRCIWGNGASFDITLLEYNYLKHFGMAPWMYRGVRDVRTIVDLAGPVDWSQYKFNGVKHDALADAIHQAHYVSSMYVKIKRGLQQV